MAVAGSVFLQWVSTGSGGVAGIDFDEGRLTIVVCLITVALIQYGLRPAWIGSGLALAIVGRQLLRADDIEGNSAGVGLWLGTILAAGALVVLVWDLFSSIEREAAET